MTPRIDYIIPECYVDTNLVDTLLDTAGCNHQKGCNQVAKTMKDKFSGRFAIGIKPRPHAKTKSSSRPSAYLLRNLAAELWFKYLNYESALKREKYLKLSL